jgi:hypothetical protein
LQTLICSPSIYITHVTPGTEISILAGWSTLVGLSPPSIENISTFGIADFRWSPVLLFLALLSFPSVIDDLRRKIARLNPTLQSLQLSWTYIGQSRVDLCRGFRTIALAIASAKSTSVR